MTNRINDALMLIGERRHHKISWIQYYQTSETMDENEIRKLFLDISSHILKRRQKPGSARKFNNGKLLYYEIEDSNSSGFRIYCLFTLSGTIDSTVKKAMKVISRRGGYYSAKRYFSELQELVQNPEKLLEEDKINHDDAIRLLYQVDLQNIDVNYLGQILSIIRKGGTLTAEILERLYFLAYEILSKLTDEHVLDDIDLALDGVYDVARSYQERETFHLALELYKRLLPLVERKGRDELEILSRVHIAEIYQAYFPESGNEIISVLYPTSFSLDRLKEVSPSIRQKYYVLLAHAYEQTGNDDFAIKYYYKAIQDAEENLGDPMSVSRGYAFFANKARNDYKFDESFKQYLTASSLAFSAGEIEEANALRCESGYDQVKFALISAMAALYHRMENNLEKAEYLAWDALKSLLEGHLNISPRYHYKMARESSEILNYAASILSIPGKKRKNMAVIRKIRKAIESIQLQQLDEASQKKQLESLISSVLKNIPISPPTFLLITSDGRLIASGLITRDGWKNPDLEGVVFSGILSAIMGLLSEVSPSSASLRTIDAGGMKIMLEKTDDVIAVLLADRETREFRDALRFILMTIAQRFSKELDVWDGNLSFVPEIKDIVLSSLINLLR